MMAGSSSPRKERLGSEQELDGLSNLSGKSLEKAMEELNEDPASRVRSIEELRGRINSWKPSKTEEKSVTLGKTESKFLLMFLRARKFDVDKALQLYVNYHAFRQKHAGMLEGLNLKSVEHVLHSGLIKVLDSRFCDGSKAICVYPGKWDSTNVPFVDNFRATLLILDKLVEDEETQVHGFSVIYDFTDSSIMSMLKVAQSELITKGVLMELLQESFPARFKGVHLLKQPWYISIVLSVIRPFMKQKLRERILGHGYDFDSLHRYIESGGLPKELGGTAATDHDATFALFDQDQQSQH
jgi:retinaldehyde-binding protein 1